MPGALPLAARLNDLTVDVSISGAARGDLLFRGASKWGNLAAGASGQFLQTQGPGADPVWADVAVAPAGDHGQLQVNQWGVLAGTPGLGYQPRGAILTVQSQGPADVPLTLRGHQGQSGDLLQVLTSAGAVTQRFASDGYTQYMNTYGVKWMHSDGNVESTWVRNGSVGGVQLSNSILIDIGGTFFGLANAAQVKWSNQNSITQGFHVGVGWAQAGTLKITNGSTGGGALQFQEMTAPGTPATDNAVLYAEDDGGKTRLVVKWSDGTTSVLATQP